MLCMGAWADTLQEQINNATAGATITLTENVTIDQTVLIDKNITINGGGHTITSSVNNKLGTFYVNTGTCNFTIQNATINGNGAASMAVVAYRGKANPGLTTVDSGDRDNNNSGNVITLSDCTVKNFKGYPDSYAGAVYGFGHSTVNLTNCTFTGNTTSLQSTDGASGADVWAGAAATVNINGGSYEEVFVNSDNTNHSSISVSNGAKIEELTVCVTENGSSTNQPAITIDNATVTNLDTEKGNDLPSTAVTTTNGGSITHMPGSYVAQIDGKKYSTLAEAFTAATSGETIVILTDINLATSTITNAIDKNVILDLNGKTISSTSGKFDNKGTLTIKSSVDGGKITRSGGGSVLKNYAGANLTITSGIIELTGKPALNLNGAIDNSGVLTINGGEVIALAYTIYESQGSETNITGGNVTSSESSAIYLGGGSCDIAGGTFASADDFVNVTIFKGELKAPESVTSNANATFTHAKSGYLYAVAGAIALAQEGDEITLLKDINAKAATVFDNTNSITLNLNGHNVVSEATALKVTKGTLTITGEGIVKGAETAKTNTKDPYSAVWANGGNVIINSGTFDEGGIDGHGNSTIYADKSAITINGGTFKNSATYEGRYWTLNKQNDVGVVLVVNGGKFYNFDPANNMNDIRDGEGTNYVADGYITEMSESGADKIYTVKVGEWEAKILDGIDSKFRFATLDDAINAANDASKDITITLLKNATATVEPSVKVTIDADGKELTLPTFNVSDGSELVYHKVTNATDNTYKVTTATYSRTGAVGTKWGTVCLPFSFVTAPTGYTLYTPASVTAEVLTVNEVEYPVAAGTPVIFYKNNTDEVTMTSADASVKINATPVAGSGSLSLVGTYTKKTITTGLSNIYYINGDKFHQAKASLTVPAYRAYINYTSPSPAKPSVLSLFVADNSTTAIESVDAEIESATTVYDANGRRLSAPQKGLNIMKLANGKTVKLIIK